MALRKVVITGMGVISPFGIGITPLMDGLCSGHSAIVSQKTEWKEHICDLNCWVGAPLKEPLPVKTILRKYRRTMGPASIMALLAVREALHQAQLPESSYTSGRTGVSFSSTTGSVNSLNKFYTAYLKNLSLKDVSAGTFFQIMSHTCAANTAHALNINGRVLSPDSACASSTQAIGFGYEAIKYGQQDIMICGGADELNAVVCGSFDLLNATSYRFNDNPAKTPRPFDKDRDGTVCGEGAGCVILEAEDSALARGATILAEISGFSTSSDGTHLAQPHSSSIIKCIRDALGDAGVSTDSINYINAHATATILGDIAEAEAIHALFGDQIPVSSFKGHIGHTLGASGVIELVGCVKMLEQGVLIPTLNFDHPGEGCEGINIVRNKQKHSITYFVKNSFAFGGVNAVLILKRTPNRILATN